MYLVHVSKWFDDIDLWGNSKNCTIMTFYSNFSGNVATDSPACAAVFTCTQQAASQILLWGNDVEQEKTRGTKRGRAKTRTRETKEERGKRGVGRELYNKTIQAYKLIIAEYTVMKIVAILETVFTW